MAHPTPRGRDGGAKRLAHDHLLAVRFGELVGIMAGDPARPGVDQRHDRKLHQIEALDQAVEQPKLGRMDDVLRVVEDHAFEPAPRRFLVGAQGGPDGVEAAGLGGRAVRASDHLPEAGIRDRLDRRDGLGIVGIAADVEAVIVVVERAQGVLEHAPDHLALVPGGNEYRERPGGRRWRQARDAGAPHARPQQAAEPHGEPDQVDEEVARAEDDEAGSREQADLAHQQGARVQQRPAPVHPAPPNRRAE